MARILTTFGVLSRKYDYKMIVSLNTRLMINMFVYSLYVYKAPKKIVVHKDLGQPLLSQFRFSLI